VTWDRAGLNALQGRRRDEHPATARARSDGWARPSTLRVALLLTLIVVVAVGGPLASGIATGAIAIPHNDDWAFSRIAFGLADHGELNLVGWNQMTLVGHLLWAIPFLAVFGTSLETLHAAQAVAAAAGLVLAFFVLRHAVPVGFALLGTVLLAIFPGYALLATTYMTDTTAFAAQMGCLLLGLIAIDRGRHAHLLLGLSLAVGLFAYTIREISLAAPLAVLAGWYLKSADARAKRETGALVAAVLALAAGFFVWRHSLPGDEEPWLIGDAPTYERVADVVRAYFTTGFALLPALILMLARVPRRPVSRWQAGAALTAFVVGAFVLARDVGGPLTLFAGNALTRVGAVDVALPGRPVLFPRTIWAAMTVAALFAGVLLAAFVARAVEEAVRRRGVGANLPDSKDGALRAVRIVIAVYLVLTVALLGLRAAAGTSGLYDRYLWGVALAVLILVATSLGSSGREPRIARFAAAGAAAAITLVSTAIVLEDNASSAARWHAGERWVERGVPATSVDAGFEWMGWHYPHLVAHPTGAAGWRDPATWYNVLEFPAASNCVVMSFAPLRESWLELVDVRRYRAFLLWGEHRVFVYRNPPACMTTAGVEAGA
jgi:hypothetical protein